MEDKNSELLFEYLRSILYDKKFSRLMWNNSMSLFGSLAGDCSILQRRLQKQNSTQQPFERKSVGAAASAGEFFVRKFKKYSCKSKSSDLAGKTGGKG